MGLRGPDVKNIHHLYLIKNKYFENQFRKEDAQNDVLNNTKPLKVPSIVPIRR